MLRHHLTLAKAVEEMRILIGYRVIECFSQEKKNLIISLFNGSETKHLHFIANTSHACFYMKDKFNKSSKNFADLFPLLIGLNLNNINLVEGDRRIELDFIHLKMYVFLYGGPKNYILLIDRNDKQIDSFNSDIKNYDKKDLQLLKRIPEFIESDKSLSLVNALIKSMPLLSKHYALEYCFRYGWASDKLLSEFTKENIEKINSEINEFYHKLKNAGEFYLLKNPTGELLLSLCELNHYPIIAETIRSANYAIERRTRKEIIENKIVNLKKTILSSLNRQKSKLIDKISNFEDNSKIETLGFKYRQWAEILISQPGQKQKPGKMIELDDWEGNSIVIKLNAEKTISENVELYFGKARQLNQEYQKRQTLLPELKKKLNLVENFKNLTETTENYKELLEIMNENIDLIGQKAGSTDSTSRFRIFDIGDGYTIYVGKNAANNDELTVKYAKPNDLWFHARGTSGSHVVLRLNKEVKPPKYIIQRAASVAAYYSGAKNAKYVPVSYTFKKYVTKPKGSNIGAVRISREEVIMVEPKLDIITDSKV